MTHDETTAHYVVVWTMPDGEGRVELRVSDTPDGTFVDRVLVTGRVRLGLFRGLDVGLEVEEMRREVRRDQLDALRHPRGATSRQAARPKRKSVKPLPMPSTNPEGETHDACA